MTTVCHQNQLREAWTCIESRQCTVASYLAGCLFSIQPDFESIDSFAGSNSTW